MGFFVVAGLGIWAAILNPTPPPAAPGRGGPARPAATTNATATPELPPDHPKVPMQLPAEVKAFIDDLAKKAAAAPEDVATWSRLAQVYYRTAQVDAAYYEQSKSAFGHVLERDPKNTDALRGLGSVHFELEEPAQAIALYERYLAIKPDDPTVRTALAAAQVSAGAFEKALAILRDVIAKKPDVWPAHYYLGIALESQGDHAGGLAAMRKARELATEDGVKAQIDATITRMGGTASAPAPSRTPFQATVEKALRDHQIMGPRIARIDWQGPGSARVMMRSFPMAAMPDEVKQKFTSRLADQLRDAAKTSAPGGPVRLEIADVETDAIMASVEPSPGG
jgi:cytochrome c-type biogenesis protein CcmH/NrfG